MTKAENKVKVICTYCGTVVEVDESVARKLNETTAFCCDKCARPKPHQVVGAASDG